MQLFVTVLGQFMLYFILIKKIFFNKRINIIMTVTENSAL